MKIQSVTCLSYTLPGLLIVSICLLLISIISRKWMVVYDVGIKNQHEISMEYHFGLWITCYFEDSTEKFCDATSEFPTFDNFNEKHVAVWLLLSCALLGVASISSFCVAIIDSVMAIKACIALFCGSCITATICCLIGLSIFGVSLNDSDFTDCKYSYSFYLAWIAAILLIILSFLAFCFACMIRVKENKGLASTTNIDDFDSTNLDSYFVRANKPNQCGEKKKSDSIDSIVDSDEDKHRVFIIDGDDQNLDKTFQTGNGNNEYLSSFGQQHGRSSLAENVETDIPQNTTNNNNHTGSESESYSIVEPELTEDSFTAVVKASDGEVLGDQSSDITDTTDSLIREYDNVIALMEEQVANEKKENEELVEAPKNIIDVAALLVDRSKKSPKNVGNEVEPSIDQNKLTLDNAVTDPYYPVPMPRKQVTKEKVDEQEKTTEQKEGSPQNGSNGKLMLDDVIVNPESPFPMTRKEKDLLHRTRSEIEIVVKAKQRGKLSHSLTQKP